jgi:tetratricopeptide (TPR) repeat protein
MAQKPTDPKAPAAKPSQPAVVPVVATPAPEPEWKKALYAPERVAKFVKGEMSLQELHGITGPEMMEMAITGFTMYEQGQYNQAKVIFEGLAALDPKEAYYQTALGAVHLAEGKLDEAIAVLDRSVKLDPRDLSGYVNRGEAYLRKGELVKAALDFKEGIKLDPEGKDPLTRRAKALAAAVLQSLEQQSPSKPAAKGAPAKPGQPAAKPAPGKPAPAAAKPAAKPAPAAAKPAAPASGAKKPAPKR